MDPTVALPLVMPGRFGVGCRVSPYSEGPFDQGAHCVTVIPAKEVLREWAELIVENWNNARWSSWSPYRSVVVRYADLDEDFLVDGSEEYYARAGDEGLHDLAAGENSFYDLIACRQLLTMAELFRDFTDAELISIKWYWSGHNGGALVLDDRLPSLADHKAIQKWVLPEFQWQLHFAFVRFDWPDWACRRKVDSYCTQELAAQNLEHEENLQRAWYTIEGYEHIRFSMVFMKKIPQLQRDALACICSFLLGRPIAHLHLVG